MKKAVAHLIPFMEAEREASYKLTGEVSQEKVVVVVLTIVLSCIGMI